MTQNSAHTDDSRAPDWHDLIRTELDAVEDRLSSAIGSRVSTVAEVSMHLLSAGGKRLRPAMVVLSAMASGPAFDTDRVIDIAAAVELVHMATLVHDDVIDDSHSRRGKATANAFWGNRMSVLSGDCMLARAFWFIAREADGRIMQALADATMRMSESEVLQAECEGSVDRWRENYWQIVRDKTAGFFSACCRCGSVLSGSDAEAEAALSDYGMELGLAFQVTDDILDVDGDPTVTGKPAGGDIREGKFTLPVLLALEAMPEVQRRITQGLVERRGLTAQEVEAVCDAIRATDGIAAARSYARAHAETAVARLADLPDTPARAALLSIARQVTHRVS